MAVELSWGPAKTVHGGACHQSRIFQGGGTPLSGALRHLASMHTSLGGLSQVASAAIWPNCSAIHRLLPKEGVSKESRRRGAPKPVKSSEKQHRCFVQACTVQHDRICPRGSYSMYLQ